MPRRKIAYIELDTHAEIAGNIMELSADSGQLEIDFFLSEKISAQLQMIESANVRISNPKTVLSDLAKDKYELVIIGTAHRFFSVWNRISKNFPTAVIVHNKNFAARSKAVIKSLILKDESLYRLKLLLKEGLLNAPEIYHNSKALFVLDTALADEQHYLLPVFFQKYSCEKKDDIITVAIPGAVDSHRRDYRHIVTKLQSTKFENPHHFIFPGKAGPEMLQQLQKLQITGAQNNFSMQFFSEKIPQKEFDRLMNSADILWCPVQKKTSFFSQEEIYGKTKMTGNVGDAIRYGKPAVFPAWYADVQPFIHHEEHDLTGLFEKLIGKTGDFQKFTKNNVLQHFENAVLKVIQEYK